MKTVLYSRVSSREQEETGYSLPAQEKLLKEYAERKSFGIAKKFSISESAGGKSQREIFNAMMEYLKKNNVKIIVCEKTDRITRNLKDAVLINDWLNEDEERQVHLVKDSLILHKNSRSQEKLNWNIRIVFAQNYIDNLSEEVKKGQKEKIAQGWLPTKPPLGYKTVGEKGHKIHLIDEQKAPFVKKMFELYATSNYSLKRLVQIMYEEGLRTRGGNRLCKGRLAELLTDPFYCGGIRWNNEIYRGKHEPLISKELFDEVQNVLHQRTTPKYRKHFTLFKGLIRCNECGGLITWDTKKGHWYGFCSRYRSCSQNKYTRQEKIEEQLLPYFEQITIKNERLADWVKKALKESHQDEIEYHNKSLDELNRYYEQIQNRLNMLYDDKLDGRIDPNFYEQKFKQYTQKKETITASIEKQSNAQTKYFELGVNIFELSQKAKEIYQKAQIEQKRMLLGLVFSNLRLNAGELSINYSKPFEILANSVIATNRIFEPAKNLVNKSQTASLRDGFAPLLRGEDSDLQPNP